MKQISAKMILVALGEPPPSITITGPQSAVLAAVEHLGTLAGAEPGARIELRRCSMCNEEWRIVETEQAESYPAFIAEVTFLPSSPPPEFVTLV